MLSGAVAMSRVPKLRAPQTSMPIQISHTASLTHSCIESGGMVSARRLIVYLHLLRAGFSRGAAARSSIVITLLVPRFPHGGGAPSPTRIVMTGNGGASFGQGVRQ